MNYSDFLLGVVAGVIGVIGIGSYLVKKDTDALLKNKLGKEKATTKDLDSVRDRLQKARDIGEQQLQLSAHAQMPSSSAMHSKYKNGLIAEIEKLENEKTAILISIIQDGFDPVIKVSGDDGIARETTLSEYMRSVGVDTSVKPTTAPTDAPQEEPKKAGKFFVIKGGKGEA